MYKIKQNIENTIIIDKSSFITYLYKVDTVDEVNNILSEIRKKHYDANHNCYAYILDNGLIQKCSDDGEPAKTAGYPMLDVLKKQDITNILAITTRYFGGIKLGTGGLVRAYSKSVSDALLNTCFTEQKEFNNYFIEIEYTYYNYFLDIENITVKASNFASNIELDILIPIDETELILDKIKNLTKSKAIIKFNEKVVIDV